MSLSVQGENRTPLPLSLPLEVDTLAKNRGIHCLFVLGKDTNLCMDGLNVNW